MKCLLLIISIIIFSGSRLEAQQDTFVVRTEFRNQGEQEDYWATRFFHQKYTGQVIAKFSGQVSSVNKQTFDYEGAKIVLLDSALDFENIFSLGLIYPGLFISDPRHTDVLRISSLEHLKFIKTDSTVRRFKLWLFREGFANAFVYLFELTNENGNISMNLPSFIKGSSLTFLGNGWVIH